VKLQANNSEANRVRNDIDVVSARGTSERRVCQFVGLGSTKLNRRQQNAPMLLFQLRQLKRERRGANVARCSQCALRTMSTWGRPASRNSSLTTVKPKRSYSAVA